MRKKLTLQIYGSASSTDGGIAVVNSNRGDVETYMAFEDVGMLLLLLVSYTTKAYPPRFQHT